MRKGERIVVIGGGQAAMSFAARARALNGDVAITMFGEEPTLPYQRPPLSKKYLSGEMPLDRLLLRDHAWFEGHDVECRVGRVEGIDRVAGRVSVNGATEPYDALFLATGSRARTLPAEIGGDLGNVFTMRTLADADALAPGLRNGGRMVVVGGGYIGLEAAAVARTLGLEVVLIEAAQRILGRVASPMTADYFRDLHRDRGVRVIEDTGLVQLDGRDGVLTGASLADGERIEADVAVVGIGIAPNVEIAEAAGLVIDNGIAVDSHCRTSDPNVLAAGDCASFPFRGERVRLESVPNAIHQAETAADNLLGEPTSYEAKPWFWSDQYDVKLQIGGLNAGYERTVRRPGRREGAQSVWYYRGDTLLAVDAMNDPPAYMMGRKIVEAGGGLPPEAAADPAVNLKGYA